MRERRSPAGARLAVAVFALTFAYFALFVRYGLNVDDEGTLLAEFHRTYLGQLPYRDFHIGYTPLGHYFQAFLFSLFGVSVEPLRWALAVSNGLVAALLFAVGRRIVPAAFALLPSLVYCAIIPFYPGEFASFNVPYPAWYGVLFGVAGFWMLLRALESGGLRWFAASGLTAGLAFSFKPNVGLFQLASAGLVFLLVLEPPAGGRASRWQGLAWWLLLLGLALGLTVVFANQAIARDVRIFLLPIGVVLLTLTLRRLAGRSADAPPRALVAAGMVYGAALLTAILPWAVAFLRVLGPQRFARQVLFIGAGFERYYYVPFHAAGRWDVALVLLAFAVAVVGLLVRARVLPASIVVSGGAVAAAAGAALFLARAEMPDGPHAALVSRSEDLSFTISLLVHWAALAFALPLLWKPARSREEMERLAILVGALATYLQLYPRSDFMHVIAAVPLTLVVGVRLAYRLAACFDASPRLGRAVRIALVGGVLGFVAVRVAPNVAAVVTWDRGPAWRPQATLDLATAPLTLELGRAPRFRELEAVVRFLRANTDPGEAIFSFPAIELVCFLSERPQATRRGHFFPGWPGHDVEAEVISHLERAPPRLAVVFHAHQFFFATAPAYYYALREFVQANYRQVADFGHYAVLARQDVQASELRRPEPEPQPEDALEERYGERIRGLPEDRLTAVHALVAERLDFPWEPAAALLDDPDPRIRGEAVRALLGANDPDVAVPLARAVLQGSVPASLRLAVLRRISATADVRAVRQLLELLPSLPDLREREVVLVTLHAVAMKLALSQYWFGIPPSPDPGAYRLPGVRGLRGRLAAPGEDLRLRMLLAWLLPRTSPRALVPSLQVALGSEWPVLRSAAAAGLLYLGADPPGLDLLEQVLPVVGSEQTFAPALALAFYRRDPVGGHHKLAAALEAASLFDREPLVWLASATGDRHFRDAFMRLYRIPEHSLRMAVLAGLERLADPATRPFLEVAALDTDYQVREFAERALAAVPKRP